MPAYLKDLKKIMKKDSSKAGKFPNGDYKSTPPNVVSRDIKDYSVLKVARLDVTPNVKKKFVEFEGVVSSESKAGLKYKVVMRFHNIEFKDKADGKFTEEAQAMENGKRKKLYYKVPTIRENMVSMKCQCFTADTLIPMADGSIKQIKDLVGLDKFYVYSFDLKANKFVIGQGYNCEVKERKATIYEVELDNGHIVKCTGDHKFLTKQNEWVEAQYLSQGTSLQAMYRKLSSDVEGKMQRVGYEQVLQQNTWEFTHVLADEFNLLNGISNKSNGTIRHHKDFDKLNNSPENIQRMSWSEHNEIHHKRMLGENNPMNNPDSLRKMLKTREERGTNLDSSRRMKIANPMFDRSTVVKSTKKKIDNGHYIGAGYNFNAKKPEVRKKMSEAKKGIKPKNSGLLAKLSRIRVENGSHNFCGDTNIINSYVKLIKRCIFDYGSFNEENYNNIRGKYQPKYETLVKHEKFEEMMRSATNHKVIAVRKTEVVADVYCFTVKEYSNFVISVDGTNRLSSGVVVHNCKDFQHRFSHELADVDSLIGNPIPYKRKTPEWPEGYPYANATSKQGFCKHIHSMVEYLKKKKLIKE